MTENHRNQKGEHPATGMLASLVGPCPRCGHGLLQAVFDGELTNFVCTECNACWHGELAWVKRVDPGTCPGCPMRDVCHAGAADYGVNDLPGRAPAVI